MIRPEDLHTKLAQDNLHTWLEHEALRLGDASQRERYAAGMLPASELATLARDALFAPFQPFRRWQKILATELRHVRPHDVTLEMITFHQEPVEALTREQWDIWKEILKATTQAGEHEWVKRANVAFRLELVRHTAHCSVCKATKSRPSVRITVPWCGRELSREYHLQHQQGA